MQAKSGRLGQLKHYAQRGFTLVELAIVLVIAGLILTAVLKGTDAVNKAKVERMVSDVRGLQSTLLEFEKRNGRLPGDCDNNGILGTGANIPLASTLLGTWAAADGNATTLDFGLANRSMPATPTGDLTSPLVTCIDNANAREESVNLVWNELRRAGVVDANRLPRELARHSMNDVFLVSTMRDTAGNGGQPAGIIVVYGIPVWMAEAIDASLDGAATVYDGITTQTGPANTGRVRLWQGTSTPMTAANLVFTAANGTNSYDQGGSDRDRLISISYQYTTNKLIR
jgi:prepilin-type N-terminal cleavage/methylation domain-containing protein